MSMGTRGAVAVKLQTAVADSSSELRSMYALRVHG